MMIGFTSTLLRLPRSSTALIFMAEPIFTVIFALLIPNSEGVRFETIIGCIIILIAMLVSELKISPQVLPLNMRLRSAIRF